MFKADDEWIPVLDLASLLGVERAAHDPREALQVLVIEHGDRKLALHVDGFLGERTITERGADKFLAGIRAIAGTSVLETGEMLLVLDAAALADDSVSRSGPVRAEASLGKAYEILVVDDSEITREMLASALARIGMRVSEAADGREALEMLLQHRPDLIVTDLEMPVMDGFELLQRVRASAGLRDIPVVVVSSRGQQPDKVRASQLGADSYIVKREYSDRMLEDTVLRLLGPEAKGPS